MKKHRPDITRIPRDHAKVLSAIAPSETREPKATWPERLLVAVVLLVCMGGVIAISHFVLAGQSIRLDESQSLLQSAHSIPGLLKAVAQDVHVPLYHILLHFWFLYFGSGISTIRLFSLLFFLATLPVFYLLSRQLLSRPWSLFATVLFSFSPFMNWYANEARMYTMLALMTALNQYFFFRILKGKKGWIGFTISALVGAYTHYFFMFNLATIGLFYLVNHAKFPKRTFLKMAGVAVLVVAELTPWLWYFVSLGSASNTRPMLVRPSSVDFFNAFSQFFYGFQNNRVNTILISCWPLLVLVAFFAVNRKQKIDTAVGYIATLAFVPVILAYVLSFVVTPFFVSRYLIAAVAPLVILIVWLVSHYQRKLAAFTVVFIAGVMGLTSYQQATSTKTPVAEKYQVAAQYITSHAQADDTVIISSPFTIYPFEYYYNGTAQIKTLPIWDRKSSGSIPGFSDGKLPEEVKQIGQNHHDMYVLLSYDQGYQEKIRIYLDTHYQRLEHKTFSEKMDLYVYRYSYDTVPPISNMKP